LATTEQRFENAVIAGILLFLFSGRIHLHLTRTDAAKNSRDSCHRMKRFALGMAYRKRTGEYIFDMISVFAEIIFGTQGLRRIKANHSEAGKLGGRRNDIQRGLPNEKLPY
jgi:hypothetical protein